jgi:hypothetical protein
MSPSHARKGNVKYRYYLSAALLQGTAARAGSVRRVPAPEIEALVIKAVRHHLKPSEPTDDRSLVHTHVAHVEVQPDRLVIHLAEAQKAKPEKPSTLEVPWQKKPARRRREILLPEGIRPEHARPIRSETRARLVAAIARGRRWLDELIADPTASAESIAKRENCSARKINMTISLAFLAPDLVKASRMAWGLLASSTCRRNGLGSTRCLVLSRALTVSDQVLPASLPSFLVDRKWRTEPPGNLSEPTT